MEREPDAVGRWNARSNAPGGVQMSLLGMCRGTAKVPTFWADSRTNSARGAKRAREATPLPPPLLVSPRGARLHAVPAEYRTPDAEELQHERPDTAAGPRKRMLNIKSDGAIVINIIDAYIAAKRSIIRWIVKGLEAVGKVVDVGPLIDAVKSLFPGTRNIDEVAAATGYGRETIKKCLHKFKVDEGSTELGRKVWARVNELSREHMRVSNEVNRFFSVVLSQKISSEGPPGALPGGPYPGGDGLDRRSSCPDRVVLTNSHSARTPSWRTID
ncbi:hypothetical protein T492DRAFT_918754 [Pavlovales sp. CCMP2436]|nr:hypothetical protein T492DRAFT_918754 [Pavlovales sp. CCMP2436]